MTKEREKKIQNEFGTNYKQDLIQKKICANKSSQLKSVIVSST